MKKLIVMSALVIGGLGVRTADAQFRINVHLNLGSQPVYVPAPPPAEVVDQPVYDDYYYLPEVEAYYSVGENCYYYYDGGSWISAAFLPGYYRNFDWRTAKRFEIRADRPYLHHDMYKGKFGGYANRADFYARAYPDRDRSRGRDQFNNDRRDSYNRGNYDQNRSNGYSQPAPDRNQGGYNRGNNDRGNNGQNRDGNRGNGQPATNQHGNDRGNYNSNEHFAANKVGVVQERNAISRPVR